MKFLKPGGRIGIVCPGLAHEIAEPPAHLKQWWEWDFCCFHSPEWWRQHWAKTGLVNVEVAEQIPDGHALWLDWYRATVHMLEGFHRKGAIDGIQMLEADRDQLFGFTGVVAQAKGGDWFSPNAVEPVD